VGVKVGEGVLEAAVAVVPVGPVAAGVPMVVAMGEPVVVTAVLPPIVGEAEVGAGQICALAQAPAPELAEQKKFPEARHHVQLVAFALHVEQAEY